MRIMKGKKILIVNYKPLKNIDNKNVKDVWLLFDL
jgi:hypothetical protein